MAAPRLNVTVVVNNAKPAYARVRRFARSVDPARRRTINSAAAIQLHSHVMQIFDNEGAFGENTRWQDLALGGRYVPDGSGGKRFTTVYQILQDTGALRQSFMPIYSEHATGVGAVSFMKHADLAPLHHFGNPARNLPARPMLPTDDEALEIAAEVYEFYITEAASP